MTARDVVLGRIRDALAGAPDRPPATPRDYRTTSDLDADQVVARFTDRVDDYHATVHRVGRDQLPDRLATLLAGQRVVIPAGLPGPWRPTGLEPTLDHGQLTAVDLDHHDAVVTGCAIAIAETGTIVLDADDDQGRRALTLVPDHHVCIVPADRIVATVPQALAQLEPTRPITLVSGPSATSDIELDRVEGVHGPRRLDVVIVT